ncbi:MAG TPA: FecR domain-containing protein [Sphingobacterium sp.]|jgi:transmembrane sensor|nr:FecR domain-containing protein [Sphingobacterium sp.]
MDKKDVLKLFARYHAGETLSKEEKLWLDSFYLHKAKETGHKLDAVDLHKNLSKVESSIREKTFKRKSIWFRKSQYGIAAAVIIFVLSASLYFYRANNLANNHVQQRILFESITAGTENAVLELANGEQFILDGSASLSVGNGNILVGNRQINLRDQGIISTAWNTLRTPNGGQFKIILDDSSTVWLNAGSQLRYPTQFGDNYREVELIGEAYFEVSHNPEKPFRVKAKDQQIEVLGTGFNISAYPNNVTRTTLVHGKVRVDQKNVGKVYSVTLNPGEQATSAQSGLQHKGADVDQITAWKNGVFSFKKSSLQAITAELERWYNVEFVFENKSIPAKQITGEISRNVNLYDIVEMLSYFEIDCKIERRTIYLDLKK